MSNSKVSVALVCAASASLAAFALVQLAPRASAQGFTVLPGARPISSLPVTITECGSYFLTGCLTGNGSGHGITVAADNVTINLNGFTLEGSGSGQWDGIHIEPGFDGIVVVNGQICCWGDDGVEGQDDSSTRLESMTVTGNGGHGANLGVASFVIDSVFKGNGTDGVYVRDGSKVANSVAMDNGRGGFTAQDGAFIDDCNSTGNTEWGFAICCTNEQAGSSRLESCHASANGIGFWEQQGAVNSTISRCSAPSNGVGHQYDGSVTCNPGNCY